jgi:predicted nucleotidyltransferase
LLDISKKIDKLSLNVIKIIKNVADDLQIEFFLVGATVRDMILHYVYDIPIYRATNDIDFAVRMRDWDQYYKLIVEVKKNGFRMDGRIEHRFYYNDLMIDFIPFGEIADENNNIRWHDNHKTKLM